MNLNINYLQYKGDLKLRRREGLKEVFDPIRKKYVRFEPEESVRQLTIQYLVQEKGYKTTLMKVEKAVEIEGRSKRYDILAYNAKLLPRLLIECKAPSVPIDQSTFMQAAWYNLPFQVPYILVTNGIKTFCCQINHSEKSWEFLRQIPAFGMIP